MTNVDRRSLLHGAALALSLPLAGLLPEPADARTGTAISPPQEPMRYRRRLTRQLGSSDQLVVERSFTIMFMPADNGFRVEGQQSSGLVEAPPALAEFARMERERVEDGLFPLTLDRSGRIVDGPAIARGSGLEEAIRMARQHIARVAANEALAGEAASFLQVLQNAAGALSSELPVDLFAPQAPWERRGEIDLPGGGRGEILARFDASRDPGTGLMTEAERSVLTTTGGERRQTVEQWSLTRA